MEAERMDFSKKIEENMDLQIQTLQELVSIKSVAGDPVVTKTGEMYPFGQGVQDAFAYTLKKAEELGFQTENIDNYGGHIDFVAGGGSAERDAGSRTELNAGGGSAERDGSGRTELNAGSRVPRTVGIVGHLDVVPEGDGWIFDPYSGAVDNGYIYGRGTTDDKGPVVAALFAMKALKDCGYEPANKVRLILGLDEETNWEGMEHYLEKVETPDFGFTPDGDFPALNGEKGMLGFEIAKKFSGTPVKGLELRSLSGGTVPNMVAAKARAVVKAEAPEEYALIKELAAGFREETGHKLKIRGVGKSLEILAEGTAAHGATPEKGVNAISIMMQFLGKLNFADDDVNDFVQFYNDYIGFDVNGKRIGCGFSDRESGELTFNVGIVHYDRKSVTLTINIRFPVTYTAEQIYEGIMPVINRFNLGVVKVSEKPPIYMPPDSPMIKAFMDVYRKNTGDYESKPLVIGGGTYAKACRNTVAFGALFPGDEDLMHQANERLSLERFTTMTKIYADAIYMLTQEDFNILEEE